ncbi:MAG: noncanonical pyrimidine nucleotidase, YjjG family [Bacteroidetes bacterium]|nr:MAG: noncanonical pyrimidine nucleotidase, YjjG family [Bacteroidota bacterium]
MSQLKHLFFDLDHTLWDFEHNSKTALREIYAHYRLENYFDHFEHFHFHYQKINRELWGLYGTHRISKAELRDTRFLKTLQQQKVHDPTLAEQLSDSYLDLSPKQTKLFPGTLETLEELRKNEYALHIITNGFEEVQYTKIKASGLEPYFDIIICSEKVGFNKPDRRIFEYALNQANAKAPESMMIGDNLEADVLGANQLGMKAILFDPHQRSSVSSFPVIHRMDQLLDRKEFTHRSGTSPEA